MAGQDLSHLAGELPEEPKPTQSDVIQAAGDFLGITALSQDLPVDFDGCTISVIKEPSTNRLMAVILSPVDMHGDEPFPRYQVNPDHVAKPKAPKILLPD